eukprot:624717-Alexandrium_andersonii.AAC.1
MPPSSSGWNSPTRYQAQARSPAPAFSLIALFPHTCGRIRCLSRATAECMSGQIQVLGAGETGS